MSSTYIGVLFEEAVGGGLAVINKNWLTPRKKEVFWPPYKTQEQYNKALKRGEIPVEDSWKLYPVSRLFFECDNFDKANAKLKKAELTSDIQTDEEDLIKNTKRPRITPKRLYDTSSDEETTTQDVGVGRNNKRHQNLPRPPVIKISDNVNQVHNFTEISPDESGFYSDRRSDLEEGLSATHSPSVKIVQNALLRSSESTASSPDLLEERSTPKRVLSITKTASTGNTISPTPSPAGSFTFSSVSENRRWETKLLDLLLQIKEQNNIIISTLNKRTCSLPSTNVLDFPVEFPLKNQDDMETLESYLKDQENLMNLSSYFASLGGRDPISKVNKILKRCFSNSLATEYSFYGKRQNKRPFNALNLKNVILNAVKAGDPGATEQDIENAIKVWLKHSPQRLKLEKNKNSSKNQ